MYISSNRDRCETLAIDLIENKSTVRHVAKKHGISKSTVHKDVAERLAYKNPQLYRQVKEVLEINKQERPIRGGLATRRKYLKNC